VADDAAEALLSDVEVVWTAAEPTVAVAEEVGARDTLGTSVEVEVQASMRAMLAPAARSRIAARLLKLPICDFLP
jgi:hypothetical protein